MTETTLPGLETVEAVLPVSKRSPWIERGPQKRLMLFSGRSNPELVPRWDHDRRTKTALGLLGRLELETLISHRIPFQRASEAYPLIDEGPEEAVQVVFTYERSYGGQDV